MPPTKGLLPSPMHVVSHCAYVERHRPKEEWYLAVLNDSLLSSLRDERQGCLQRTIPSGQKPMEAEWNRATVGMETKLMKDRRR